MMLPTHALAGMLLALPVAVVAPEYAAVSLGAGFLGGVLPDLDMYVGHRRTLHYPVYLPAFALPAVAVAVLTPTWVTVGAAALLVAAAVHSVTDVFGGGLELRPWEATSDRAVYDHHNGRWIAPRRLVRYDGSPADLGLSVLLAVPLLVVLEGPFEWLVAGALAVAVVYTGVRRRLPDFAELLLDRLLSRHLPESLRPYVPGRYRSAGNDGSDGTGGERPTAAVNGR